MEKPKYENKNCGPERKPWSIKDFPVKLRRDLKVQAVKEGVTLTAKLEEVVSDSLKGKKAK